MRGCVGRLCKRVVCPGLLLAMTTLNAQRNRILNRRVGSPDTRRAFANLGEAVERRHLAPVPGGGRGHGGGDLQLALPGHYGHQPPGNGRGTADPGGQGDPEAPPPRQVAALSQPLSDSTPLKCGADTVANQAPLSAESESHAMKGHHFMLSAWILQCKDEDRIRADRDNPYAFH